ncbi:MAG: cysteine desulfurase family protein [Bdellovibrionota bacterium]|nr:cysteine desulfurase family protein [Bdellovibrionota bacterium]
MKKSVYLDYHATTPVDPKVLEAMLPFFTECFGNAASQHPWGWSATDAVEKARLQVARSLSASPEEIVFTGGATEASHLALMGLFDQYGDQANHLITTNTEHKSILSICERLVERGAELTILEADSEGKISPEQLENAIRDNTLFVSIIHSNNEIGSINPIKEIAEVCKRKNVFFHTDAVQAIGKVPFSLEEIQADLVSLTAHKFYGPKGTGVLYIRDKKPKIQLKTYLVGGGHESGRRSGTLNVPGIIGLGEAIEIASKNLEQESIKIADLREKLLEKISKICAQNSVDFLINGPKDLSQKLPNNLSLSFKNIDGAKLKSGMRLVAFSTGSACSTASATASHVLTAIGLDKTLANSTIRLSTGRFTTEDDINTFMSFFEPALKASLL